MSKAAVREQRRAQRIARRNRQRIIIGIIIALIVVALTGLCCWAAFIYLLIK